MKKLYFLDEEEKNRILNLHESATKRQYLSEQTKPTQAELDKREARWKTDLKCVPAQLNAKKTVRADNTTSYDINGIRYFNDGIKITSDKKRAPYSCATEFKSGVSTQDKAKKAQQYKQQVVTKTTDTTKQMQKLLGLPETGVMDSGLLQKINDKLNGKPQEAAKSDVATQPRPKVEPLQTSLKPAGVVQQQLTTPSPEQLTAGLQQQQKAAEAAKTPPTNKEKRQERRDLRASNKAEMQALRDKQRGNQ